MCRWCLKPRVERHVQRTQTEIRRGPKTKLWSTMDILAVNAKPVLTLGGRSSMVDRSLFPVGHEKWRSTVVAFLEEGYEKALPAPNSEGFCGVCFSFTFECVFCLPCNASDGKVKSGNQAQPKKFIEYCSVCWGKLELVCFKIVYRSKIK